MQEPKNPFILGHRIRRPYFCDRNKEQEALMSAIENGRNVVLISPRRMGKTSLAYVTLHDSEIFENDHLIFFIDILQTNSLGEFTYLLGKTIFEGLKKRSISRLRTFLASLKSLNGTFGFDALSGTPTFDIQLGDIKHPEYTLEEIFTFIEQCEKPVIIVIDEFQQITKYPEKNVEAILRNQIQQLSNSTFIFAGSEQTLLQEMFVSSKRPFYNSSDIMHLGPIELDEYISFVKEMFGKYGKKIESEAISKTFNIFNGNTFYIQRTMNGAFADTAAGAVCTTDTIIRSIKSMLAVNEVIYRELLSNISINQKSALYAIAQEGVVANPTSAAFIKSHALSSASSVQSALQKLTRSGIIQRQPQGYSLTDPLLRIFINKLYFQSEI